MDWVRRVMSVMGVYDLSGRVGLGVVTDLDGLRLFSIFEKETVTVLPGFVSCVFILLCQLEISSDGRDIFISVYTMCSDIGSVFTIMNSLVSQYLILLCGILI